MVLEQVCTTGNFVSLRNTDVMSKLSMVLSEVSDDPVINNNSLYPISGSDSLTYLRSIL